MRLRIEHKTTFTYEEPINEAYTEMRLKPSDACGQTCLSFALNTEPRGLVMQYVDRYGNDVRHFNVLPAHTKLSVIAISDVLTPNELRDYEVELSPLDEFDYLSETRYAPHPDAIRAYAAPHAVEGNPFATAMAIMRAIYYSMKYEPGATNVQTSAMQALELKKGVCQDFAHLMLSMCRSLNVPARYVSGYLHGPSSTADDAASHAWVDVFIASKGWVSLDPTHNCPQSERYVRLGVGRDYADVPPTRGTYKGNADEHLEVKVSVREL
jgi:transglutaminase-like putative cysteine protease